MSKSSCILLSLFAVIAIASLTADAADDKPVEKPTPNFIGRIVMLVVDHSNAMESKRGTEYLENAQLQEIGGRYFIFGDAYSPNSEKSESDESSEASEDWRKGSQVGIAWDKVQQFYVFSPEQMDNMVKKWTKDRTEQ